MAGRPVRVITSKATLLSRQFRAVANGLYNLMSLLKVRSVLLSLRERSFRSVEISLCSLFMRPPTESPCAFEKPSGWLELWNDGKCVCAAHRQYGQPHRRRPRLSWPQRSSFQLLEWRDFLSMERFCLRGKRANGGPSQDAAALARYAGCARPLRLRLRLARAAPRSSRR